MLIYCYFNLLKPGIKVISKYGNLKSIWVLQPLYNKVKYSYIDVTDVKKLSTNLFSGSDRVKASVAVRILIGFGKRKNYTKKQHINTIEEKKIMPLYMIKRRKCTRGK